MPKCPHCGNEHYDDRTGHCPNSGCQHHIRQPLSALTEQQIADQISQPGNHHFVIDMTPTWREILTTLLVVYTDGSAKGRADCLKELQKMATIADLHVEHVESQKAEHYQIAEFDLMAGRWKLVAHGAAYSAKDAGEMKARIEARSGKVMLLPC